MEQIAAVQAGTAQMSLRNILGMAGQQTQGDAFAMIFQQLMGQEDGFGSLFSQLVDVQQDDQEESNKLGMQMMAEMLYANPEMQNLLPLVRQALQPEQNVQSIGKGIRNDIAAVFQNPVVQPEEKEAEQTEVKPVSKDFYTVLQDNWKEQQPSFGIHLAGDTLRQAKQLLAQKSKETIQTQDVESLQADVDAGRFLNAESVAPKTIEEIPDVNEIADQLKTGISENISQGKNEFVVRLKPEGLGEVVVKLSENKEKISLSIFTSSEQTAKMISNEVLSLQNALRPLHAEVEQITVTPDERAAEYAAQNSMNDQSQQFAGQQFAEQWQRSFRSQMQENSDFGSIVEEILPDDGLDTYI